MYSLHGWKSYPYCNIFLFKLMYLYVGYINEVTNFAESQGGGGSDTKDWGREKDENCANSDPQENSLPCQWLSAKPKVVLLLLYLISRQRI